MEIDPTTNDCKSQGTQWTLQSYSKINDLNSMEWNLLGMVDMQRQYN